jgi:hypothetical protein
MIITNYAYNSNVAGHYFGGITNPLQWIQPHTMRGYFYRDSVMVGTGGGTNIVYKDSFPTGTNPPYSIVMGDKGAVISATTTLDNTSSLNGSASSGINLLSSLTGIGELTASASLITSMNASIAGSGTLVGSLVGTIALNAVLTGEGNVSASLGLIANMLVDIDGAGSLTAALRGTLDLDANIYVNQSEAEVQQIVAAVWNAIAADFNAAGTMGNKLNSAGSSGDPWSTILPGTYTGDEAGALLLAYLKKIKAISSANL